MINIVCFGNELHGDDGIGLAVHDYLAGMALPAGVSLFYAGHNGLNALRYFEDCQQVIIVDAMQPDGEPGRIHQINAHRYLAQLNDVNPLSSHRLSIPELVKVLYKTLRQPPRVELFALEATAVTGFKPGLSKAVGDRIECFAEQVYRYAANVQLALHSARFQLDAAGAGVEVCR